MPIRKLDSPQNPVVKATAKLRTSRGRQQTGLIIIDGEREIRRAARCGLSIESIFIKSGGPGNWETLASNVYEVSRRAHEKIAFGNRLEPVAVANRPDTSLTSIGGRPDKLLRDDALIVVLDAVEKPGNVGAVLRSADGAGVTAVVLVDPLSDLYNPNAIRASLGTIFSVATATASFDEYRQWASANKIRSLLAACDDKATAYTDVDYSGRTALVLGNEAHGLTAKWGGIGDSVKVAIPMRGIADSLNVAAAATVLMYEAKRISGH